MRLGLDFAFDGVGFNVGDAAAGRELVKVVPNAETDPDLATIALALALEMVRAAALDTALFTAVAPMMAFPDLETAVAFMPILVARCTLIDVFLGAFAGLVTDLIALEAKFGVALR